jgi:hypothetical protein
MSKVYVQLPQMAKNRQIRSPWPDSNSNDRKKWREGIFFIENQRMLKSPRPAHTPQDRKHLVIFSLNIFCEVMHNCDSFYFKSYCKLGSILEQMPALV